MYDAELRFRRDILPLSGRLFRLALALLGHREEAEDVVQDVMLRLWEKREEWNAINSLEAWCITAVRNACIDRRRVHRELEELPSDEGRQTTPSPHERLVAAERLAAVNRLLEGLPEAQRSIFVLREVEGKSYAEMGQLLNLSESQVKTYLLRARRKIMAGMKDEE